MRTVTYEYNDNFDNKRIIHFMNINIKGCLDLDLLYDMEEKIKFVNPDIIWFSDLLNGDGELNNLSYYNLCCFFYEYMNKYDIFVSVLDKDLSNRLYKKFDEFGINLIPQGINPMDVEKVRVRK